MVQMEHEAYDRDGADDDDLRPPHHNRISRASDIAVNWRSTVRSFPYPRVHDMETQIHLLEQEAYAAVLRAFKGQSDAITWDKEGLITELRKELRVSNDEHRELLTRVNSEDIIRMIREWRPSNVNQMIKHYPSQPVYDIGPSPTISAPTTRKKQKTSQLTVPLSGVTTMKAGPYDSLVGRRVWTKWPEDNSFYEAVVKDYDSTTGQHALLYDVNKANETWEWVDLNEIPPGNILWDDEDPGIARQERYTGQRLVYKTSQSFGRSTPAAGRGRGRLINQSTEEFSEPPIGIGKKILDDIELLNTDELVKEVEKVFNSSIWDPSTLEKAKKMLRKHEQALVDAIAKLAYVSDGESEEEQPNIQS